MTARDDAIEAGARTLLRPDVYGLTLEDAAEFAAAVVDAAEPIFAAERERDWAEAFARVDAEARADERERLRAQVPQLPLWGTGLVRVSDVLALLLGGESDE